MNGAASDPLGMQEIWRQKTPEIRQRLVDSIRQTASARSFTRTVLGLSGGLDSTLAAALCVEALGAENVLAVLMPHRTTSPSSLSLAQGVVNALGITSRRVNMSPVVDAYFANFPDANRFRRGFCLAWERVGVMLDLSHHYGGLLVQTVNRTDRELRYGDANLELTVSLKPLSGLFKSQLFLLAEEMQILPEVRKRRPTLEYWAGQSDESDFGHPYSVIDPVLHALLDDKLGESDLSAKGIPLAAIQWVRTELGGRSAEARLTGSARLSGT